MNGRQPDKKEELYVFIDNSYLFIEGYKFVRQITKIPANKSPYADYFTLKQYLAENGDVRRAVICGSELPGSMISKCQSVGFEVFTLPRYPSIKTGRKQEKGVDHKICWEIAKTIFTNHDPTRNKKIILCTGDKDFMSILPDIQTSNWDFELWLWSNSYSTSFENQVKIFGSIKVLDEQWKKIFKIGDSSSASSATGVPSHKTN